MKKILLVSLVIFYSAHGFFEEWSWWSKMVIAGGALALGVYAHGVRKTKRGVYLYEYPSSVAPLNIKVEGADTGDDERSSTLEGREYQLTERLMGKPIIKVTVIRPWKTALLFPFSKFYRERKDTNTWLLRDSVEDSKIMIDIPANYKYKINIISILK